MKHLSIELTRVSNGVVIKPPGPREPTLVVFNNLKALQAWLALWWAANNVEI